MSLHNQVALVTRASRGVGRAIATTLCRAGSFVYATGRSIADADLEPSIIRMPCDHTDDAKVRRVSISFWAAQKYLGNVIYGISKAATDKLTFDCAHELKRRDVTAVSLYPGLVATEAVVAAGVFDLSRAESPEFVGRAVAALAADPSVSRWNGQVVVAAALARDYGFTDENGRVPPVLTLADV